MWLAVFDQPYYFSPNCILNPAQHVVAKSRVGKLGTLNAFRITGIAKLASAKVALALQQDPITLDMQVI
jgi:hypothetical protein